MPPPPGPHDLVGLVLANCYLFNNPAVESEVIRRFDSARQDGMNFREAKAQIEADIKADVQRRGCTQHQIGRINRMVDDAIDYHKLALPVTLAEITSPDLVDNERFQVEQLCRVRTLIGELKKQTSAKEAIRIEMHNRIAKAPAAQEVGYHVDVVTAIHRWADEELDVPTWAERRKRLAENSQPKTSEAGEQCQNAPATSSEQPAPWTPAELEAAKDGGDREASTVQESQCDLARTFPTQGRSRRQLELGCRAREHADDRVGILLRGPTPRSDLNELVIKTLNVLQPEGPECQPLSAHHQNPSQVKSPKLS